MFFIIPGEIISLVTFPGVIVHEIAHRLFADLAGVPVYQVCYFRYGNPSGYVLHGQTSTVWQSFLISVGPLIINTTLCMLLTLSPQVIHQLEPTLFTYFLWWLGLSIGMHAIPSAHDIQNLNDSIKQSETNTILLIAPMAFSFLLRACNALRIIWFDIMYATLISMILPMYYNLYVL